MDKLISRPSAAKWSAPKLENYGGEHLPSNSTSSPHVTVSVVTPVLNGARYLEDAIRSVHSQDYPRIEFIIIDGGSTDGTVDIIRKYEEQIHSWISEPDLGLYDAINKGIARTTGQLVKILNADDVLTKASVSTAVALFNKVGPAAVVASDIDLIDADGKVLRRIERKRWRGPLGPMLHTSWYVGRSLYERLGLYKVEYLVAADYDMFARFRLNEVRFAYAEMPLIRFRSGGVSTRSFSLRGEFERYHIMRHELPRRVALHSFVDYGFRKFLKRLLVLSLGETRTHELLKRVLKR